ncbi:MAG: DUF423 domain-containing protein [Planctomycetota bacterium]
MSKADTNRNWWILVACTGALGVAFGAFGAHGLGTLLADSGMEVEKVAKRVSQFETGSRYHLIHAVAMLALVTGRPIRGGVRFSVILFVLGVILFSGSLYVLVLSDTPWLGAVTPLGGLSWILAWSSLAFAGEARATSEREH